MHRGHLAVTLEARTPSQVLFLLLRLLVRLLVRLWLFWQLSVLVSFITILQILRNGMIDACDLKRETARGLGIWSDATTVEGFGDL